MVVTTSYKVRSGPGLPVLGGGTVSRGVIIFTFGVETQDIEMDCVKKVDITSQDMCLMSDPRDTTKTPYFSATFKAMPGKIHNELVFHTTKAKKPVITNEYEGFGKVSSLSMADCVSRCETCETPDPIIDTSTLIINFDNQGNVTIQLQISTKSKEPIYGAIPGANIGGDCLTTLINDLGFIGFIDSDDPRQIPGTEYFEHNLSLRGLICRNNWSNISSVT